MTPKAFALTGLAIMFATAGLMVMGLGGIDSGTTPVGGLLPLAGFLIGLTLYVAGLYKLHTRWYGYLFVIVIISSLVCWTISIVTGATEPGTKLQEGPWAWVVVDWPLLSLFIIPVWALIELIRVAIKK